MGYINHLLTDMHITCIQAMIRFPRDRLLILHQASLRAESARETYNFAPELMKTMGLGKL